MTKSSRYALQEEIPLAGAPEWPLPEIPKVVINQFVDGPMAAYVDFPPSDGSLFRRASAWANEPEPSSKTNRLRLQ
jgi:hypothetical protein